MKRLIALLLAACMTVSLAACGGSSSTGSTGNGGQATEAAEPAEAAAPAADGAGGLAADRLGGNPGGGFRAAAGAGGRGGGGARGGAGRGGWRRAPGTASRRTKKIGSARGRTRRPSHRWRRGESNSGPKQNPGRCLQAQSQIESRTRRTL